MTATTKVKKEKAVKAPAAPVKQPQPTDTKRKELIYKNIQDRIEEKTGRRIGKNFAKTVFDTVVKDIFVVVKEDGYIRLPAGHGSLIKTTIGKTGSKKRLPSGKVVPVGPREVIRYRTGTRASETVEA